MRGCDQLKKKQAKKTLHLIHTSVLGLPCSLSALKSLHTCVQMGSDLASIFAGIFYAQCVFLCLQLICLISLGAFCDAMMETLQWKIALALYWKKSLVTVTVV